MTVYNKQRLIDEFSIKTVFSDGCSISCVNIFLRCQVVFLPFLNSVGVCVRISVIVMYAHVTEPALCTYQVI